MIVVIGGAGYIGSVLCKKLVHKGYDVLVVDKGFYGFGGLKSIESKIKILKKDAFLLKEEELENVDCVINLAGMSNDPTADFNPDLNFRLNTDLTENTALKAKTAGVKKYIFASSCSIYDFGLDDESKDVLVDETAEVNPTRYYSLSKYKAENILRDLEDDNFKVLIIRKATVYGYSERMRYDLVVNKFVKDALQKGEMHLHMGGEIWRPLISVNDISDIYIKCIEGNQNGLYNAVGLNVRISEVALRVYSALKKTGLKTDLFCDYLFGQTGIRNYRVDGSKLKKDMGFEPKVSIQDSVAEILSNIEKINDFNNPVYCNIEWVEKYLQYWM